MAHFGMQLGLEGKHIAVFGSSNGIGHAIALGFRAEGCCVKGFDRTTREGIETVEGHVASGRQTSTTQGS